MSNLGRSCLPLLFRRAVPTLVHCARSNGDERFLFVLDISLALPELFLQHFNH